MSNYDEQRDDVGSSVERLWHEAAGRVQSDEDIDVLSEARGLMIAEMGEVSMADRRRALAQGAQLHLGLRDGSWLSGAVVHNAVDHVVLENRATSAAGRSQWIVVPEHSIVAGVDIPRALHQDPATPKAVTESWHATLRDLLGRVVTIDVGGQAISGTVNWVGRDHVTIDSEHGSTTCMWRAVDALRIG